MSGELSDGAVARLREMLTFPEVPGERYELVEPIGRGGMGVVYRARDRLLEREVALKVLRPDAGGADLAARLRREARILARLEHPGIVPIHDAGTLADGRVFYVMKLVRGERLDQVAATEPLREVLRRFLRVCEAVGFAHARGVVHRDLKPANVMIGAFGEVLVLDWGIARILPEGGIEEGDRGEAASAFRGHGEPTLGEPATTARGAVLGTPGFMAPEQAAGDQSLVDPRADVFSLGVMLRAIAGENPPAPLASIMRRATSLEPRARYPTAEALAEDVARFMDALPVLAHREGFVERAGRLYAKYQTAILLVLAYLLMRFLFLVARGL